MTWRLFDIDGDGVKTAKEFFYVVRTAVYIFSGLWAVLHVSQFSDIQFIATIAASFGASVFETFIINWKSNVNGGNKFRKEPDRETGIPA